jgi:hypothetical protein
MDKNIIANNGNINQINNQDEESKSELESEELEEE